MVRLGQGGMDVIARHESELTAYALLKLRDVPKLQIFGSSDVQEAEQRLGVIPMLVEDKTHFLVAAILGYEFGIGVRSGCFCAHPYILHLLHLTPNEARTVRQHIIDGDRSNMPGMIRASFGLYNTKEEIDAFANALVKIIQGEYDGNYVQEISSGEFTPDGWAASYENYFSFE